MTFEELGVRPRTSEILGRQGIITPNPVQRQAIPALMRGRDEVMQAPTGSGKTLAFLLPMLERLFGPSPVDGSRRPQSTSRRPGPRALIVGPTRELASQIAAVLTGLDPRLRVAVLFGGVPYGKQRQALASSPEVVIGCPGRILDLAGQSLVGFGGVEFLVLDEADEMLDQGFAPQVERIIAMTPASRQTVLASATIPDWVGLMIAKHLRSPETIRVAAEVEPALQHALLAVGRETKVHTLHRILGRQRGQTIVFHRTKHGAKKLARDLGRLGHSVSELQGNLSQNARDRATRSFRRGDTAVLVATNVAARGIDVAGVDLVVNYELPETVEWLTHRIGRTARNGAEGKALTFLSEDDGVKWSKLRRLGAPNLPHLDGERLLANEEWEHLPATRDPQASRPRAAARAQSVSPPPEPARRSRHRRRRPSTGSGPEPTSPQDRRPTSRQSSGPTAGARPLQWRGRAPRPSPAAENSRTTAGNRPAR